MMMYKHKIGRSLALLGFCLYAAGCKVPAIVQTATHDTLPSAFRGSTDTTTLAAVPWRSFFTDKHLSDLIDTALNNNQELMITLQEIEIARNEIRSRKAALLPTVGFRAGAGFEKVGRYTSQGAGDASTEITPGREMPEVLPDYLVALQANWEIDIWKKLRNAKKAAVTRYLATVEGKNFVLTNLIAEVANTYYELVALDNQLAIVRQNIDLQKNALEVIRVQKEAARTTELAVKKFEAEVLGSRSLEFDILQQIKEAENRLHLLLGRYPREIPREKGNLQDLVPPVVRAGIPAQLLANRPDIKQAELELTAAKLDVNVARAEFFPSLGISGSLGFQAFNPSYLFRLPESLLGSLMGDLAGPLINRNAIRAEFNNASAKQVQALYNYEKTVLNAYLEVATQLSRIDNLGQSYELKTQQVAALTRSI